MADCQRRAAVKQLRDGITSKGYTIRPDTKGIAAVLGTAVHAGAAHMLEGLQRGQGYSTPDAVEVAIENLRKNAVDVVWDWTTPSLYTGEHQVIRMVKAYELIADTLTPTGIEISIQGTVSGVTVTGHPDVICGDTLRDLKTGKAKSYDLQMGGYIEVLSQAGTHIKEVFLDFIQRVALKKEQPAPYSERLDTQACKEAATRVIGQFARAGEEFDTTGDINAFAVNPLSPYCRRDTCPAFDTDACKYGREYP